MTIAYGLRCEDRPTTYKAQLIIRRACHGDLHEVWIGVET